MGVGRETGGEGEEVAVEVRQMGKTVRASDRPHLAGTNT